MGYTTDFDGAISIDPPLNKSEADYLEWFNETRHNRSDIGKPGYYCQWVPNIDGDALIWDKGEKFYHAEQWMKYLIDHFLKPGAEAKGQPGFEQFTFNHVLNGEILAQGEDPDDKWKLIVKDNRVYTARSETVYSDPVEITSTEDPYAKVFGW